MRRKAEYGNRRKEIMAGVFTTGCVESSELLSKSTQIHFDYITLNAYMQLFFHLFFSLLPAMLILCH